MISFFEDIFQYESFPTEFECFKLLSDVHNYIAVPWTQILNSRWIDFPGNKGRDYFLKQLSKYKVGTQNNFTICQHDDFKQLELYFKHLNITKVFCTLHSRDDVIEGAVLIPISFAFNNTYSKNVNKDILVSFVGTSTTHPIRETLRQNLIGKYFIYRNNYHRESVGQNKQQAELEYKSILERSIFTLCPRGSSPSSVRFWESLSAGSIPVLISDSWALPEWDWDNTIVRLPEKEISNLNYTELKHILENKDVESLRKNCLDAYEKFKKENFREYILKKI